jgi:hypothetical protein
MLKYLRRFWIVSTETTTRKPDMSKLKNIDSIQTSLLRRQRQPGKRSK